MMNEEIAQVFERMARLLAFKSGDRFRIRAYERAAVSMRDLVDDVSDIARRGELREIPGIGDDLAGMIQEYISTRRMRRYEREARGLAPGLLDLMSIPGLGPKTLARIAATTGIDGIAGLKKVLNDGSLLKLKGFGAKKIDNLRRGIEMWEASSGRMLIGIALPLAEDLLSQVRRIPGIRKAELAGSLRRRREDIGDVDLLISADRHEAAIQAFTALPAVTKILEQGPTKAAVIIEGGIRVDVRAVAGDSFGAALQYFTGSKQHNIHLRTLARGSGMKFNEYGVFRGPRRLGGATEAEVYGYLHMPEIPPEIREDHGEIEAALENRLPKLIRVQDLRGDLHAHSTYSDGKSTMEEMVERAAELGYEYLAISDHSPSQRIARGLSVERLEEKIAELAELRRRRTGAPKILLGAEVDILADGRLDYPDSVLRRLDVVVAAIHSSFRQDRDRMTKRILDAIANPFVRVLAHPTGRLIGTREPIAFDFEKVVAAAAGRSVALEINASMYRLDLNEGLARTAQDGGALLCIGSDAHSTAQLEMIRYGVFQARRGWISPDSVVNTWPLKRMLAWLSGREERQRVHRAS